MYVNPVNDDCKNNIYMLNIVYLFFFNSFILLLINSACFSFFVSLKICWYVFLSNFLSSLSILPLFCDTQ